MRASSSDDCEQITVKLEVGLGFQHYYRIAD
jgi:hypothetical protein